VLQDSVGVDTDDQQLSISNDTIFLQDGGFVVLPSGAVDTDDQTLSISGDTLFIQDGNFVLLNDEVNDADADSTNEIQTLSQSGDTIFLTDGGFVIVPDQTDHDWYQIGTMNGIPSNISQDIYTFGSTSVGHAGTPAARLDVLVTMEPIIHCNCEREITGMIQAAAKSYSVLMEQPTSAIRLEPVTCQPEGMAMP
jgi:hypothetical protein